MSKQLTIDDARQSLNAHLAFKGAEVREKYGPQLGWDDLLRLLEDRTCVRYPCEVRFDGGPLLAGEFAHPVAKGQAPEDGFTICVHPVFENQLDRVPSLVLYQLVLVNYGEFASADDAETFGSTALGISKDDYYEALCELADLVAPCTTTA
ncbi:MAG TPA: hypothetical protein VNZ64_27740 [Candidatus Acidoferrum sp.]|jgi:hypothetical protein|nr:hypothetical protein [Candidatus Acidoferrum sp.]